MAKQAYYHHHHHHHHLSHQLIDVNTSHTPEKGPKPTLAKQAYSQHRHHYHQAE
jgi:hypothetical protein